MSEVRSLSQKIKTALLDEKYTALNEEIKNAKDQARRPPPPAHKTRLVDDVRAANALSGGPRCYLCGEVGISGSPGDVVTGLGVSIGGVDSLIIIINEWKSVLCRGGRCEYL